jgi:4-amino-4-deoxy-L-arabinose transferase-like glycosyltransferase
LLAGQVAHAGDYTARSGAGGTRGPTAYFPPAFPYLLAGVDLLDGHRGAGARAVAGARVAEAMLGTASAALVGLLALELFGAAVGMLALLIAAVYPAWIALSAVVVAENLLTLFVIGAVWALVRARRAPSGRPQLGWIALAGILTGLAALSHVNGAVLAVPGLLAAAAWGGAGRRRLVPTLTFLLAAVLTVAPWTIRDAVVLHRFIPISDETGVTLVGTYNAASAHDRAIPDAWRYFAVIPGEHRLVRLARRLTEPELSGRLERQAFDYIDRHPSAPLRVAARNVLRLAELEGSFAWRASAASIGIDGGTARIGVFGFWVLGLLALLGFAGSARARSAPWWVWAVPLLLALSVVLVNAETPRFREPIDAFLMLPAACALAAAAQRRRSPG